MDNIQRKWLKWALLVIISTGYLLAAVSLATHRAPWCDEGWFALPAYTLLTKGYMGSPIVHPRGTMLTQELTGIRTHTYWIMPGYPLLQVVWYSLFGFGIFQMRAISVCAGLCAMWAWAFIIWKLTQNKVAAYLTAAILAADITFLNGASDGRMDMTTVAFGSLGLAGFLALRERSLRLALLVANAFAGAAMYCHPNGIIYAFLLIVFVAYFDLRRLRWNHIFSLTPYAVFAGAWLGYILERPDDFLAQFKANATSPAAERAAGLKHPLAGIVHEVTLRYFQHFGGVSFWAQLPSLTRVIPFLYWGCVVWLIYESVRRKERPAIFVCACAVATFLFMGIFIGFKAGYYLEAIIPLYAACAALAVCPAAGKCNRIPLAMLTVLIVANGFALAVALYHDDYRDGYIPAMAFLKSHATPETPITGESALLFALSDYHIMDDVRLHDPAKYVVVDRWYTIFWNPCFRSLEPATATDVQRKLTAYRPVFEQNGWAVLRRIE